MLIILLLKSHLEEILINKVLFGSQFSKINSALNRMPTSEEVGEMCLYLASKKASAITGQCINVDCGVLPQ